MKKYWTGKEIEGRLFGIETLFIAGDFNNFDDVSRNFHHILIGTSLIDEMQQKDTVVTWQKIEDLIDEQGIMVTIESYPHQLKTIPHKMKLKAHILLWIDCPEISELKSSDSVKLSIKDHDMFVYTLHNGQRVTRNDYINDNYKEI